MAPEAPVAPKPVAPVAPAPVAPVAPIVPASVIVQLVYVPILLVEFTLIVNVFSVQLIILPTI